MRPSAPRSRPPLGATGALAAVTLLALALRLLRLGSLGDLEFDEIVSVRYAALPPGELLPTLAGALFEHPPVYYLLLGGWLGVSGSAPASQEGDLMARALSVFPGALLVPLTYALGARVVGRRAGLLAALTVSLGPLTLFYSREARMYELVACLAAAVSWLYLRALARPASTARWVAFGVAGIASVLVHYAGLLVVLAQPLGALWQRRERRRALPGVYAVAVILGAAGAWALAASGVRGSLPALDVANLALVPASLWQVWRESAAGPETTGWRTVLAGSALAVVAAVGLWRMPHTAAPVALSGAAGLMSLAVAVALGKPAQARYLLVAAPFVAVATGRALSDARPSLPHAVATIAAVVALATGSLPWAAEYFTTYRRADYSEITSFIAAHERPGDAILLTGPWQAWYFDYFYPRAGGTILHRVLPADAPPALEPAEASEALRSISTASRRLWFVEAGLAQADPAHAVEGWLRRNAWPAMRAPHRNGVLSLYALSPPDALRLLRPTDFGGAVRLVGGWVDGEEVSAGDIVRLSLDVELVTALSGPHKASLRLVGADGQRLATDFDITDVARGGQPLHAWRPGERATIQTGVWVPVTANPQPYDVRLVIYDSATLSPLTPGVASAGEGGEVSLGGVYVTQTRAALRPPESGYAPAGRTFGGGEEFDAFRLLGLRWHQSAPDAAPLSFDLLWQIEGGSGTLHRSIVTVRDGAGALWLEDAAPLFSGSFAMRDWRPGETLGERRAVDITAMPPGDYTLTVRLVDARGRLLPVAGASNAHELEIRRVVRAAQPSFNRRLGGLARRLFGNLAVLAGG
ncbi:MAG TPA: glycosyltransferase family 39 protein [Chloroflexota bacterium]|nr:glycosyltransferase family 39 protein [Chloroflexota bacterium]